MACGATGGHITNGVSLASYLKSKSDQIDIQFVIPENLRFAQILKKKKFTYHFIPVKPPPSKFSFTFVYFVIKFFQSFLKSVIILNKVNPEIIIGFGSYASVPVILANFLRFKKAEVILHEQNVIAGKANIFLSKVVATVAVSFRGSADFFKKKAVFTGNPIKEELTQITREKAIDILDLEENKFNILITGGSQGSSFINQLVIKTLKDLDLRDKEHIQIIHITGSKDYSLVCSEYQRINFRFVKVYDFLEEIEHALIACDLVVTRAGATTLAEITALGKPAILIPYPYARGHQQINADYLQKHNAAIVFRQEDLDPKEFKNAFLNLIHNEEKLKSMHQSSNALGMLDANEKFAELISEISNKTS